VLVATTALLESVLKAANIDIPPERRPTALVTLTPEEVLETARTCGVPVFAEAAGDRLILLSSFGLDLTNPGIRITLIEMHRWGRLHLTCIDVDAARADLAARGLRVDLIEQSAIDDAGTTFHAVVVS
jgi:hypothetical protein